MHGATSWLALAVTGIAGIAVGWTDAAADPAGTVVVPVVGEGGRPVFCGGNHTGGRARPRADGGYEVRGLAAGRHVIHLELGDERIDVLVTVAAGEDLVVPPVVVRGACRDLSLREPLIDLARAAELPAWTLRIGRRYAARPGLAPAVYERDRGLIRRGEAQKPARDARLPFTHGL